MAGRLTALLHRVASHPAAYNRIQRLAGAGAIRRRLEAVIATLGQSGTVLDLGGGTGLYRDLWPVGWRYLCLDNDPEKLRGFFQHHARTGDGALLADIGAVPLDDGSVDVVLCSAVSHHLSDDLFATFVAECARLLRPGGALIFLDAVWRSERVISSLLWRYDRGSAPRTASRLTAALSTAFAIDQATSFAIMHEYLLIAGSPRAALDRAEVTRAVRQELAKSHPLHDGDAVLGQPDDTATYDPAYFSRLYAIEDRHFWFRARNRVIATVVGQIVSPLARGYRVLDIGCGTGVVLQALQQTCTDGDVIGIDPFPEALAFARTRTHGELIVGDAANLPISGKVEVIGLFDVLEHLEDDTGVLRGLHDRLVPGGALILTVPAGPELWSYFDEASHHQRRYTRSSLDRVLRDAGFAVEFVSSFMSALYPLLRVSRHAAEWTKRNTDAGNDRSDQLAIQELRIVPGVNGVLAWILGQESRLIEKRIGMPFGTSLIAVARVSAADGGVQPRIPPAANVA